MLAHRFQVLLDEERYQRVTALARERGVSTATIIREAIDRGLPASHSRRSNAARRILDAPDMEVPANPADLRAELDVARARRT
jgi:predicted DNA-binding protein